MIPETRIRAELEATVKEMHARELHHFEEEKLRAEAEAKLREAEAVIEKVREIVEPPKPFELGKSMMRSFDRMIGDLRKTLATYKPTNQEENRDEH